MQDIAPPVSGRLGYPLGFIAAVAVTEVVVAAGGAAHPWVTLGVLALTATVVAAVTTLTAALAAAAFSWALHDGFVLGRHGELVFTGTSAVSAAVLCTMVLISYATAQAIRKGHLS